MAGRTPSAAVDAFLLRVRSTLGCLGPCVVIASGVSVDRSHALTIFASGQDNPNELRLSVRGRPDSVRLRLAHQFVVETDASFGASGRFTVRTTAYQYHLLSADSTELVLYHWDPSGTVPRPHLHVPTAGANLTYAQAGSRRGMVVTYLSKVHFPTGHMTIEDIVELLIAELGADPARSDWQDVLADNRAATGSASRS